jgi:hypothetical protein
VSPTRTITLLSAFWITQISCLNPLRYLHTGIVTLAQVSEIEADQEAGQDERRNPASHQVLPPEHASDRHA